MSPSGARTGRFVCVVGPSGAGKDTLIELAREAFGDDARYVFVRRLITRGPGHGEDHQPISEERFEEAEREGQFAVSWRAHGLRYAVPHSVVGSVESGRIVVCNMSRVAVPDAKRLFPTSVVLVTAPPEILAARLAARGRETAPDVLARLRRQIPPSALADYDLVIDNVDVPAAGAAALTGFLRALATHDAVCSQEPLPASPERPSIW